MDEILLKHSFIVLKERDDELKWPLNKASVMLASKLGYKYKMSEVLGDVSYCWWKLV